MLLAPHGILAAAEGMANFYIVFIGLFIIAAGFGLPCETATNPFVTVLDSEAADISGLIWRKLLTPLSILSPLCLGKSLILS